MRSNSKVSPVARRLLPLAAGATLVLIVTGVSRRRAQPSPRTLAYDLPPPVAPSVVVDVPRPPEAATPATVRAERRQVRSRLGPIMVAVALVLSGLGIGLMGVAVASQRRVPDLPATATATATASQVATTPRTWGWEASAQPSVALSPQTETPRVRPSPVSTEVVLHSSRPVSLSIPAIGVRSVVNDVGQAADGSLETPQPGPHYNEAAWYRHSPAPGSLGPSILLGHVDSAAEGPSVFFRLGELRAGDRVTVTRADKSVAVFRVDLVQRYAKNDFPTDTVYGNTDHAGLRILTCGGAFDRSSGHYVDNVVVFASLVRPPAP